MDIYFELHRDLPREGPGDADSTRRALSLLAVPKQPRILDIGCGPGAQTLVLAQSTKGTIYAIDTHRPFLEAVSQRARHAGITHHIAPCQMSMFDLGVLPNSMDVIWAEGAVYILGFDEGLAQWQRYLKPGGYLVVSELCWLLPNPPEPVAAFWQANYGAMRSIEANRAAISRFGLSGGCALCVARSKLVDRLLRTNGTTYRRTSTDSPK